MRTLSEENINEENIIQKEPVMHLIKYMGSKRNILESVSNAIESVHSSDNYLVDLFAGSSVLSGAFRNKTKIISNDIQEYSSVLTNVYLGDYKWDEHPNDIIEQIINKAEKYVREFKEKHSIYFEYPPHMTIEDFTKVEEQQRDLINQDFNVSHYLFTKNYSGTYWSFEQCIWIDALRKVADEYKDDAIYHAILGSLMFAMSYNSQSTGHFAQYRDATSESSLKDIMIYRRKEIVPFFKRKLEAIKEEFGRNNFEYETRTQDYKDCLDTIPVNSTVYADPPYCFVHYSRFYHALETLVKYDYPELKHKGRYRTDRHQSPFCIKTKVEKAFVDMFERIKSKEANLVLSYSNTGMFELDDLIELADSIFGYKYEIHIEVQEYAHSTMGRLKDKTRDVQECIIIIEKNKG